MLRLRKTKLANGKVVREGDIVAFVNSDGVQCVDSIKRRTANCVHPITGRKLKKGSLYFWNSGFEPADYENAEVFIKQHKRK